MEIRVRMAPSPTGKLHLGTAYATLWPFLFARKNNGTFILRIEDTDQQRSTQEFTDNIVESLKWLHLDWDEGPYFQMDRLKLYQEKADQLLKSSQAYYCFCTKEELEIEKQKQTAEKKPQIYSGKCRHLSYEEAVAKKEQGMPYVVRFKMPEDRGKIIFEDLIHGKIEFDSALLGDMVIMRQNGIPLYNFAVVVDDIDMKITHVIRGDDHISNTPKQVVFFEALSAPLPQFIHYPMILNQDRVGKLSKRTGSTSVGDYKHEGYLPEAIVNYLALLGWTPPGEKEVLTLQEIIALFDVKQMNPSGAAWNSEKLDWINGEYIRQMSDEELTQQLEDYLVDHPAKEKIAPLVPLIKTRIKKLSDFIPLTDFIFEKPEYDKEVFDKLKIDDVVNALQKIQKKLEEMGDTWEAEKFEETFRELAEELDLSVTVMFQLIRVAVSGQLVTPPLFETIKIIGEMAILERVKQAISFVQENHQ